MRSWYPRTGLVDAAPIWIESINSDPKVRLVLHVGDIHSGACPAPARG